MRFMINIPYKLRNQGKFKKMNEGFPEINKWGGPK